MIFFVAALIALAAAQQSTTRPVSSAATTAPAGTTTAPAGTTWRTTQSPFTPSAPAGTTTAPAGTTWGATPSWNATAAATTTAPWSVSAPWSTEWCSGQPNNAWSACSTDDDRVRWVAEATRSVNSNNGMSSMTGSLLVIGSVQQVVQDRGQPYARVQLSDAWSVERGVVQRETRPIFAWACPSYATARNWNTTANVTAAFPSGRKVLLFAQQDWSFNGTANLIVSPCAGEVRDACVDASNAKCQSGLARQMLIVAASANPELGRLLSINAASTCSPTCANGACKLGVCECPSAWMGAACDVRRPDPPRVTVTTARIVPGAGSNGTDVWISGTKRKIQIPILSSDRSIPTGFARVMLLNLNVASWCRSRLPNATVDGLPAWFFADSSEVDPTTSPRYLATELLAVVDLSTLKWFPGTKAKATIQIEHTLTLSEQCKDAGVGYRIAVMLSANRNDDAALAGPYAGGQFAISVGGCIGDGAAGVCMTSLGSTDPCRSGNNYGSPLRVRAKSVTAGQCLGADAACCIPDRSNTAPAPIGAYSFLSLDMPRSLPTAEGPPSSSYAWGETVALSWKTNPNRPQPSPFSLFFPDGFCAVDQGLDAPTTSFELLLVASSGTGGQFGVVRSLGKVKLSAGKFDVALEQPQNYYAPALQIVAKFSDSCQYSSQPFQVRESPCFSTATKTLVGTCRASCPTWGDEANVIGSCTGLKHAAKCCGRIRNSNDGFRFADEDNVDDDAAPEAAAAASLGAAGAAALTAALVAAI